MGLPFQARTPAWNRETKQGKGQEANQGKAVRPYPALPAAPFSECLFLCQSMGIPENISLSGRIRREPKEEEQDDIWMNSEQFTTDEVRPLRNVSLPAPGRAWGGPKECREWGALAKLVRAPEWAATARHPLRDNTNGCQVKRKMV